MTNQGENTADIVENLSEQVQSLQSRVDQLSNRLVLLEQGRAAAPTQPLQQTSTSVQPQVPEGPPALFDTSALLPRISTICFLMVVAMLVR